MNETLMLALSWAAGVSLGAVFFGGLWWTTSKALLSRWPAVWFSGSLLLRVAIVLTGLYAVGHADGLRLLACLLGFLVAQIIAMAWRRPKGSNNVRQIRGATHAP